MNLKNYIEIGEKRLGGRSTLANHLDIHRDALTAAKSNRRGLPNDACIKLAQLTSVEPLEVIAASELVTEKKPEKRDFWLQYTSAEAKNPCLHTAGVTGSSPVPPTNTTYPARAIP
ncbi:MAG: hypothetical protein LBF93_13395 [Zoogloeaceae bacterium]|nr:hypothetical protein [Zoogloeaceae bacterium]